VTSRIQQFASRFEQDRIDAYLITHDINITYLTRFPASESWLLVFPKKAFYITDSSYVLEARKALNEITVQPYSRSITESFFHLAQSMRAKRIGFDERHVSLALFKRMKKDCPKGIKLIARNNAVEQMRAVKGRDEITQIRAALRINLEAYRYLKSILKPGLTERDILSRLDRYVKSRRALFSFDPIVASGPHSCFPHARITDRRIRNNESVLIDMGIDHCGYKSDLTRMFFLGKIPSSIQEVNTIVKAAQRKAIAKIRPHVAAAEVDQEARNHFKENKLEKFFSHSLGHGVGLQVHEWPQISQKSSAILTEGMVFTVEPAIYIPDKFGIRIEDMVLVTHDGCEVLSEAS
jgi:Xaa-Pro aminopeptidase